MYEDDRDRAQALTDADRCLGEQRWPDELGLASLRNGRNNETFAGGLV